MPNRVDDVRFRIERVREGGALFSSWVGARLDVEVSRLGGVLGLLEFAEGVFVKLNGRRGSGLTMVGPSSDIVCCYKPHWLPRERSTRMTALEWCFVSNAVDCDMTPYRTTFCQALSAIENAFELWG